MRAADPFEQGIIPAETARQVGASMSADRTAARRCLNMVSIPPRGWHEAGSPVRAPELASTSAERRACRGNPLIPQSRSASRLIRSAKPVAARYESLPRSWDLGVVLRRFSRLRVGPAARQSLEARQ
jgi:hypothetical protein